MIEYHIKKKEKFIMALSIKNDKVITIVPPKKLSTNERNKLVNTPINDKLIKKATSRKYNIV